MNDITRTSKEQIIEALRPFAEIGAWLFARNLPDETPVIEVHHINNIRSALTRGQFKAASLALRALESTAPEPPSALAAMEHVLKVFTSMADRGHYPIELLPYVEDKPNPHYLGKQGWEFLTDAIKAARSAQPPGEDERTLRRLLAFSYSSGHLYGDDGELQDNRLPHPIDYVRDAVAEIERKINARGIDRLLSESSLLREIDEYLGRSPAEAIHAGSILHQKVKELLQWLPRTSPTKESGHG